MKTNEVKSKIQMDIERELKCVGDKIKVCTKAITNNIEMPAYDVGTEYEKEKIKDI